MSAFNWGDPHPLLLDRKRRKREADEHTVRKFVEVVSTANTTYLRGAGGVREGLTAFDREAANVRHWQAWAARAFAANPDDTLNIVAGRSRVQA